MLRPPAGRGMSLLEMLVVISIMGVLAALLIPALMPARQAAARAQCQNNLRQISLALLSHATAAPISSCREVVLQPRTYDEAPATGERQAWGWAYQILPYIDQQNRWLNARDAVVRGSHIPLYLCPVQERRTLVFSGQPVGAMDYVGNACSDCDLASTSPGNGMGNGNGNGPPSSLWMTGPDRQDGGFVQAREEAVSSAGTPLAVLFLAVFVAEKQRLTAPTACNDSTGWVSGYPEVQGSSIVGHDVLFSGHEGSPADDERSEAIQCTSRAEGPHVTGGNVLLGDGSVRLMSFGMDDSLWRALLSVGGQEDFDLVAQRVLSQ